MHSAINCPNCGTPIDLDLTGLVQGHRFSCPGCSARIGIHHGSQPRVREAVTGMQALMQERRKGARQADARARVTTSMRTRK